MTTKETGATILERLTDLLRQGGVHSSAALAEALGTSPPMVEAMLEDLARRGYLRPVEGNCPAHCRGCSLAGACTVTGSGRIWSLAKDSATAAQPRKP